MSLINRLVRQGSNREATTRQPSIQLHFDSQPRDGVVVSDTLFPELVLDGAETIISGLTGADLNGFPVIEVSAALGQLGPSQFSLTLQKSVPEDAQPLGGVTGFHLQVPIGDSALTPGTWVTSGQFFDPNLSVNVAIKRHQQFFQNQAPSYI